MFLLHICNEVCLILFCIKFQLLILVNFWKLLILNCDNILKVTNVSFYIVHTIAIPVFNIFIKFRKKKTFYKKVKKKTNMKYYFYILVIKMSNILKIFNLICIFHSINVKVMFTVSRTSRICSRCIKYTWNNIQTKHRDSPCIYCQSQG